MEFQLAAEVPHRGRLDNFAQQAGSRVGPLAGGLVIFIFSLRACRKLESNFILHGVLIGSLSTMMGVALLLALADRFSLLFVGSYLYRFLSAIGGGYIAQQQEFSSRGKVTA